MESKEFFRAISKIIRQAYRDGKPETITAEIRNFLKRNKLDNKKEANKLRKLIEEVEITKAVDKIFDFKKVAISMIDTNFAKMQGQINAKVLREVRLGLSHGEGVRQLTTRLKHIEGIANHHADAISNTARISASRADVIDKAINAGAVEFEMIGPSAGARLWCAEHLGQIHTLSEWQQMNNGQGLPVVPYLGGYRCRHTLKPIFKNK